ncbi:MAG: hypothetical protein ACXACR_07815 [Candidatus Hodarchaeales archaeon]|jgi:hypothetical protein
MKEETRIGIPYQFTRPDGKSITSFRYFHPKCVPRETIKSILEDFDSLSSLEAINGEEILQVLKKRQNEKPKKDPRVQSSRDSRNKPFIEPSKSSRGSCRTCEKKIEKGILRVAEPNLVELEDGRKFFSHRFHHIKCFLESSSDMNLVFQELILLSSQRNSISESDIEVITEELQEYLSADVTAAGVLSLITEDPIKVKSLEKLARKKGVPVESLKQALERGLLEGIFFEPSPGLIQRL